MKNIDKIQSMTTKELAFLLSYFSTCDHCVFNEEDCVRKIYNHEINCEEGIAKWLEKDEQTQQ